MSTLTLVLSVFMQYSNEGLRPHLANTVASVSSQDAIPVDTHSFMEVDVDIGVPFAVVDEIADASPSAEDGLELGDQIVKFGNVESGGGLLRRLASEAQSNQGHAVALVVLRHGVLINLAVTPRPWHGRGLLGYVDLFFCFFPLKLSFHSYMVSFFCRCHFRIL